MPNRTPASPGHDPRVGTIAGAGLHGANPGSSIADQIDPDDYAAYWRERFMAQPTYRSSYDWNDYESAYRMGYDTYSTHHARELDDAADAALARRWSQSRGQSRLEWVDARPAVRDAWRGVDYMLLSARRGSGSH